MPDPTPAPRPFADVLAEHSGGRIADDLAHALRDLVEAVATTGRKGALTLTLTVAPTDLGPDAVMLTAKIVGRPPLPLTPTPSTSSTPTPTYATATRGRLALALEPRPTTVAKAPAEQATRRPRRTPAYATIEAERDALRDHLADARRELAAAHSARADAVAQTLRAVARAEHAERLLALAVAALGRMAPRRRRPTAPAADALAADRRRRPRHRPRPPRAARPAPADRSATGSRSPSATTPSIPTTTSRPSSRDPRRRVDRRRRPIHPPDRLPPPSPPRPTPVGAPRTARRAIRNRKPLDPADRAVDAGLALRACLVELDLGPRVAAIGIENPIGPWRSGDRALLPILGALTMAAWPVGVAWYYPNEWRELVGCTGAATQTKEGGHARLEALYADAVRRASTSTSSTRSASPSPTAAPSTPPSKRAPDDRRNGWLRLDVGFAEHPKILGLPDAAVVAHLRAMCWSGRAGTDGHIPSGRRPVRQAGRTFSRSSTPAYGTRCPTVPTSSTTGPNTSRRPTPRPELDGSAANGHRRYRTPTDNADRNA